ncbi:MAG: hypothetical protein IK024_10890 [Treponema sp.]|nr:hypothetical protein [Treponema sp.]
MTNSARKGLAKLIFIILFILLVRWANAAPTMRENSENISYTVLQNNV